MLRNYRKSKRSLSLKIYQHVKRTSITESTNLAKDINRFHISALNVNNIETHNYYISTLFCWKYTNIFTIIGEGKKRADTYLKVGIQHRMTPSDEQKTERRRRADGKKKRKKERKKKVHPWPSTDFNFVVRKERTSRIVSTLPVNNVPSECGRRGRGGGAGERKVTVHFFPGFIFPAPNPSVCH